MKRLAICTDNRDYDLRLQEYLSSRAANEYLVMCFSNIDDLMSENRKKKLEIVIVQDSVWDEICLKDKENRGRKSNPEELFGMVICLTEDNPGKETDNYESSRLDKGEAFESTAGNVKYIYRYSPAAKILKGFINDVDVEMGRVRNETIYYDTYSLSDDNYKDHSKTVSKIIGIYSPVGASGATSLSIAMASAMGLKGKVLMISMEGFSPLTEMLYLDDRYTLSDVLYAYKTRVSDDKSVMATIASCISRTDEYSIIAPIKSYYELSKVTEDDWKGLLEMVARSEEFEYVIIELSDAADGLFSLIEMCSTVFIPEREGMENEYKMRAFREELRRMTTKEFYDRRIRFLNIPDNVFRDMDYENIASTRFGKWVRQMYESI